MTSVVFSEVHLGKTCASLWFICCILSHLITPLYVLFYRLHKFLLQPRGVRSTEESRNVKVEQKTPLKSKNVVRKLRVEGKTIVLLMIG